MQQAIFAVYADATVSCVTSVQALLDRHYKRRATALGITENMDGKPRCRAPDNSRVVVLAVGEGYGIQYNCPVS